MAWWAAHVRRRQGSAPPPAAPLTPALSGRAEHLAARSRDLPAIAGPISSTYRDGLSALPWLLRPRPGVQPASQVYRGGWARCRGCCVSARFPASGMGMRVAGCGQGMADGWACPGFCPRTKRRRSGVPTPMLVAVLLLGCQGSVGEVAGSGRTRTRVGWGERRWRPRSEESWSVGRGVFPVGAWSR